MNTQTKQLYETAKAVINRNLPVDKIYNNLDKLKEAISAFEQSIEQPEAIAGEKQIAEILAEVTEVPIYMIMNDIYMNIFNIPK